MPNEGINLNRIPDEIVLDAENKEAGEVFHMDSEQALAEIRDIENFIEAMPDGEEKTLKLASLANLKLFVEGVQNTNL